MNTHFVKQDWFKHLCFFLSGLFAGLIICGFVLIQNSKAEKAVRIFLARNQLLGQVVYTYAKSDILGSKIIIEKPILIGKAALPYEIDIKAIMAKKTDFSNAGGTLQFAVSGLAINTLEMARWKNTDAKEANKKLADFSLLHDLAKYPWLGFMLANVYEFDADITFSLDYNAAKQTATLKLDVGSNSFADIRSTVVFAGIDDKVYAECVKLLEYTAAQQGIATRAVGVMPKPDMDVLGNIQLAGLNAVINDEGTLEGLRAYLRYQQWQMPNQKKEVVFSAENQLALTNYLVGKKMPAAQAQKLVAEIASYAVNNSVISIESSIEEPVYLKDINLNNLEGLSRFAARINLSFIEPPNPFAYWLSGLIK